MSESTCYRKNYKTFSDCQKFGKFAQSRKEKLKENTGCFKLFKSIKQKNQKEIRGEAEEKREAMKSVREDQRWFFLSTEGENRPCYITKRGRKKRSFSLKIGKLAKKPECRLVFFVEKRKKVHNI